MSQRWSAIFCATGAWGLKNIRTVWFDHKICDLEKSNSWYAPGSSWTDSNLRLRRVGTCCTVAVGDKHFELLSARHPEPFVLFVPLIIVPAGPGMVLIVAFSGFIFWTAKSNFEIGTFGRIFSVDAPEPGVFVKMKDIHSPWTYIASLKISINL